MFSPSIVITAFCIYMAALFLIARWVEWKASSGNNIADNPLIYSLSLAVYLSAWTFYGSVGKAATSGMLFITIYLGPTISSLLWWIVLRKMIKIRNIYKVNSIADFISLRYNKSLLMAALVTAVAIAGIVPYLALQLKAIISTFEIITYSPGTTGFPSGNMAVELIIAGFIILFTIVFGVRRLVPTERHQGIVVAMAAESLMKLVAFLTVGIFVTYYLFHGVGDVFKSFSQSPLSKSISNGQAGYSTAANWLTYLLLSMSAIMFLPRQFHMAVVENFDEKHIRTAMWLFPCYMLLMTLFVFPIAMAGLLRGYPIQQADSFVLTLPFYSGHAWLSLLVFLGGFSAATGMLMISSMTLATMSTNHLLLPLIESARRLGFLKHYLLQCRWISIAVFILAGYWFERKIGVYFTLVDIGMISFSAVFQFTPAILGGLFWKRGNKSGALIGMGAGFLVWFYTLILPAFAKGGLISNAFLENGPWGIEILRPEHLFNMTGLDPISHAMFWTMLLNVGLYVLGSLYVEQSQEERSLSEEFVNALAATAAPVRLVVAATIDQAAKKRKIEELFLHYFPPAKSAELAGRCLSRLHLDQKRAISIAELAELYSEAEKHLAASVGAATAHKAIQKSEIISPAEETALKKIYADIIAELKVTPSDLKKKIDYYREKETLLTRQAAELEEKIKELDKEISERKRLEDQLRQAQKMEAVGLLAGGVAHDFNNILAAIIGYGNILQMKMKEGDPLRYIADQILAASEKAANLTRNLLAFSRNQIINPKPVDFNEFVRGIERFLPTIIGEDIKLRAILADEDLTIMADPGQMEQVLVNLCTNARDAMPDGGELLIETGTIQIDHEYIKSHGYGEPGKYVLLTVTDSGSGMDEETRKRIFEPFFTTKETGRGTGLGLSIVYGIVKQHEGHINVYSESGKGTTVKIYLPLLLPHQALSLSSL